MRFSETVIALALCVGAPRLVTAQAVPSGATPVPNASAVLEAVDRFKDMRLSDAELRKRLSDAGVDPTYADSLRRLMTSPDPTAAASPGVLAVLAKIAPNPQGTEEQKTKHDVEINGGKGNFGRDIFGGANSSFDPITSGPLDPSYRLGFGDEVQLVLTGDVEEVYPLLIQRDGTVVIPQLGQVALVGLTLDAARGVIKNRAARVYSGIGSGKTHVDLSVTRVRSIQVFVIGEASSPGAYQMSSVATLFYAVSRAGGPSPKGSFRRIELRRAGKLLRTVDLYDYLTRGDASNDVRLEQGDLVFIPLATKHVSIEGAVRREGHYELLPDESLADVLHLAGGLTANAATDRIQVDRVLPPSERRPGRNRAILDIRLGIDSVALARTPVYDDDSVSVFGVDSVRRGAIRILGEVFRPGTYEFGDTLTLAGLIGLGGGLTPWSLPDRIKVTRLVPATGRKIFASLNFADTASRRFRMAEFDQVEVLDARLLGPRDSVQIIGAVTKDSVELQYAANLRLQDMIDLAGGLRIDAGLVEIVRRKVGADFSDTTSVVTSIPVAPDGSIPIAAGNQTLERGDRIFVRSSPGYVASRSVILDGQFVRPGTYILARENETVAEVIKRAGGILPTGAPTTFRLIREGRVVPIGLEDVLAGRNVRENIPLVHGDILTVERTPTTVLVIGAVQRQVAVPYREGWRLRDYISAAGGFTSDATRGVVTEAPDGAVSVKTLHAMPFIDGPRVFPGSVVTAVAKVPTSDAAFRDSISFALQVTSALATLLVTLVLLKR